MNPFRPRKLRIVESGWANYTGTFGNVDFLDGISVDPVPWREQQRLGGLIRMESAEEEDEQAEIGPAAELIRNRDLSTDDPIVAGADVIVRIGDEDRLAAANHTREELEDLADKRGLAGLREVAVGWGVIGRSIPDLITKILQAQGVEPRDDEPAMKPATLDA